MICALFSFAIGGITIFCSTKMEKAEVYSKHILEAA
jgi:hypothetical protein